MKRFAAVLLLAATLNGCWLDSFYAKKDGAPSTAEGVQAAVKVIPVYGDLISYAIGAVGTIFGLGTHVHHKKKHKKLANDNARLAVENLNLKRDEGTPTV